MSYQELLYDVVDGLGIITFNRPSKLNAWTAILENELRIAIGVAARDTSVRVIILTGAGRGFCAGADFERLRLASTSSAVASLPAPRISSDDFDQRYSYLLAVPKPIVAAINGPAFGVGLCLSLYCDLRFAAADATLSSAFVRRGLIAEHGAAWMLTRLIGPMNAADVLLSGRTLSADEAERIGLVKVLPGPDFLEAVREQVRPMVELASPRAMAIVKRQLALAATQSLAAATQLADQAQLECVGTPDFLEGVAGLLARRRPVFAGLGAEEGSPTPTSART